MPNMQSINSNSNLDSATFPELIKLRFADHELEESYLNSQFPTDLFQFRIAFVLAILLLLFDSGFEYLLHPSSSAVGNSFRIFIVVPMIAILILFSFIKFNRKAFTLFSSMSATLVGATLIYTLYLYDQSGSNGLSSYVGWLNLFFILLFGMVIIGIGFRYALFVSAIQFIIFLSALQFVGKYEMTVFIYNCYQALSVALLCILLGFCRELFFRRDYILRFKLKAAHEESEHLLHNILPVPIASRLKLKNQTLVDSFDETSILFADIVGFTLLSVKSSPETLVAMLNDIFSRFDDLAEKHGLEKIKTIGDAYMLAAGIPEPQENHAMAIADMALDMIQVIKQLSDEFSKSLKIRIGINSGPVVAGVIGKKKFSYDLWGDSVNTAARMESHGVPGEIQVTENTYNLLKNKYNFVQRGKIEIKGKGLMKTYFLKEKQS